METDGTPGWRETVAYRCAMPRSVRTAEPASARGIVEDLKKVREVGGLDKAGASDIKSLMSVLQVVESNTDSLLDAAKRRLRAEIVRACWARLQTSLDPCDRGAAHAVRRLLLRRTAESPGKARTIRVDVLSRVGCSLSPDGLRKREDVLLDEIGTSIWESLQDLYERSTSESPMTIAYEMLPTVSSVREDIHDLKKRLYPKHETVPVPLLEKLVPLVLHQVGTLRWLSFRLVNAIEAERERTKGDDYLLILGRLLLDGPVLNGAEDQDEFAKFYAINFRLEPQEFFQLLVEEDGALAERCLNWLSDCHRSCAYMRTLSTGLLCRAHQFAALLEQFEDLMRDVETGEDLTFLASPLAATPAEE